MNDADSVYYDQISDQNLYSKDIKIRGRVTKKEDLRPFKTKKIDGQVFNIQITDGSHEPKNVIKGSFFNETAEKFEDFLKEGCVYVFSGALTQPRNRSFNHTKHDVELKFNAKTTIEVCNESKFIPLQSNNFTSISEIENLDNHCEIDVLCCMLAVGDEKDVNLKNGEACRKRNYVIFDESCKSITLAVWHVNSEKEPKGLDLLQQKIPVAIRNLKVNEFRGRNVITMPATVIQPVDQLPTTIKRLSNFLEFVKKKDTDQITSIANAQQFTASNGINLITNLKFIYDNASEAIQNLEAPKDGKKKVKFYSVLASVAYIPRKNILYLACPKEGCMKKADLTEDNRYYCEKCNYSFETPKPRFLGNIHLIDHSGSLWAMVNSQAVGEKLFGISAKECWELSKHSEHELLNHQKDRFLEEYQCAIMVQESFWNNEISIKYAIISAESTKDNYSKSKSMLEQNIMLYERK